MKRRAVAETDAPRRVLVTGASGAIGRAIALALARAGFDIAVHYRRGELAAKTTAREIEELGRSAALVCFDVGDREETAAALAAELATAPFYGVVSNAGVHADAAFPALQPDAWESVLRTNLDGFYHVVQPLVMPMIRAHRGGRIVAISSLSALLGNRGQVNYSAAKAGLIGAAKALSLELAVRHITVNCVAPGIIATEMSQGAAQAMLPLIPMQRLGTPEDVAAAVAFLFSAGASYITGQVLSVNGGLA